MDQRGHPGVGRQIKVKARSRSSCGSDPLQGTTSKHLHSHPECRPLWAGAEGSGDVEVWAGLMSRYRLNTPPFGCWIFQILRFRYRCTQDDIEGWFSQQKWRVELAFRHILFSSASMADGRGIRMHAMPVFFCFPHGTVEDSAGIAGNSPFGERLAWCGPYSSPITLRGIRGSSLVSAGGMPAVRLRRADVVRVGAFRSYRAVDLCLVARSIYGPIGSRTIGETKPIHTRVSYLPLFDRIRICFQYPPVEPVPALVWWPVISTDR